MSERDMMIQKIRAADFAMWEVHLFLDTHPNDTDALALLAKYTKRRDALVDEFEKKFGPLSMRNITSGTRWQWIDNPWPWDLTQEAQDNVGL